MNDHTTTAYIDYSETEYGAEIAGEPRYIIPFLLNAAHEDASKKTTDRNWFVVRMAGTIDEARRTDAWIGTAEYVLSMLWPVVTVPARFDAGFDPSY